ncbi:FG-GAP repeat domain-containing protein [Anditalea andensis]|uniref:Cytochrome c domain-containing protein n=1 Tax=Anditalea andensis TaxID=1048983 RepID=A0A074KZJ0_9BACT|nr:VCBS repeat-containing protein [Anditalea andensis]KEO74344.1 hypothetical protein EL17_06305 [Anditalea andensis]
MVIKLKLMRLDGYLSQAYIYKAVLLLFLLGCTREHREYIHSDEEQETARLQELAEMDLILDGHQLANAYCNVCHIKPEPDLLTKNVWKGNVLPDMRKRMGLLYPHESKSIPGTIEAKIYHDHTYISIENYAKIEEYYVQNAPEQPLPQNQHQEILLGIPGFELESPDFPYKKPSVTTMLRKGERDNLILLGDRLNSLYVIDHKNQIILDSIPIDSPASDIRLKKSKGFDLLTMGKMDPSSEAIGSYWDYSILGDDKIDSKKLINSLNRPVNFSFADLNQNGHEDVVISNFGNHMGSLSWYEKNESGYQEHVLRNHPGARRSIIKDMNGDGLPDIVVLMAQAKEGVYIFYNKGSGQFKEEMVLQFHPLFGLSDFELVDFNGDGHLDILLTNGDNADLSAISKNYHGVRIFLNDTKNHFDEKWFFPMYGASRAVAGDFNGDGNIDIAAISFFPNKAQSPRQDFLYFDNEGDFNFKPYALDVPLDANWLILEKADIDGDGDEDLLLGSFKFSDMKSFGFALSEFNENWKPYYILKNQFVR